MMVKYFFYQKAIFLSLNCKMFPGGDMPLAPGRVQGRGGGCWQPLQGQETGPGKVPQLSSPLPGSVQH